MKIPLVVLAVLSIIGGFIELPATLGNMPIFSDFVNSALPPVRAVSGAMSAESTMQIVASAVSLFGMYVAYLLFLRNRRYVERATASTMGHALHRLWSSGWAFDWLYDKVFVKPFFWAARINRDDFVDLFYDGIAWYNRSFHAALGLTQSGKVRGYAMGIAIGAILTLGIALVLL